MRRVLPGLKLLTVRRQHSGMTPGCRRNSATEVPFLPPVSAGLFWCLVFAVCPGDVPKGDAHPLTPQASLLDRGATCGPLAVYMSLYENPNSGPVPLPALR